MNKNLPIFNSFSSGEVTPRMLARSDIDAYKNGCRRLENMIATSHGPANSRVGTRMLWWDDEDKYADGRIYAYSINNDVNVFVLILIKKVTLDVDLKVLQPDEKLVVTQSEFLDDVDFTQNEYYWKRAVLDVDYPEAVEFGAEFNRPNTRMYPNRNTNFSASRDGFAEIFQEFEVNNPNGLDVYRIRLDARTPTGKLPVTQLTVKINMRDGAEETIYQKIITNGSFEIDETFLHPNTRTDMVITIIANGDENLLDRALDIYACSIEYQNTTINSIDPIYEVAAPWSRNDVLNMQAEAPPSGESMYFATPGQLPQKLEYDIDLDFWSFGPMDNSNIPVEWIANNYPVAITFYQGRMWLGGTKRQPETMWASRSDDIEDFTQGPDAAESLEFTLNQRGRIKWITGVKTLLVGTENGEHVSESEGGVIVPNDFQVNQQSAYGSSNIQSSKIGQKVLYISPDGRKLREIGYQWTDEGWISRDISFASEHITKAGNTIKDITFAQNPDNLAWNVTELGNLVCCTYEKTYDVIGWHNHTTRGRYKSVASLEVSGTSLLGVLVNRSINDKSTIMLECMVDDVKCYMDSWDYKYDAFGDTEFSGFDHLAGNKVQVILDGGVHPDVDVTSNGEITLQWEGKEIYIGHKYVPLLQTLPIDTTDQGVGSNPLMKGLSRIYVRCLNSAAPVINGERQAERDPQTPMDLPEPLATIDYEVADLGYSIQNGVTIYQDLPLNLEVLGIFGEMTQELL